MLDLIIIFSTYFALFQESLNRGPDNDGSICAAVKTDAPKATESRVTHRVLTEIRGRADKDVSHHKEDMVNTESCTSPIEITGAILGLLGVRDNNRDDTSQNTAVQNDHNRHTLNQRLSLAIEIDLNFWVSLFSRLLLPLHPILVHVWRQYYRCNTVRLRCYGMAPNTTIGAHLSLNLRQLNRLYSFFLISSNRIHSLLHLKVFVKYIRSLISSNQHFALSSTLRSCEINWGYLSLIGGLSFSSSGKLLFSKLHLLESSDLSSLIVCKTA